MKPKFYLVGGALRDRYLGLEAKDLDYVVVCESFGELRQAVLDRGGEIFVETPKHLTIRAKIPELGATDFVCARKDGAYSDGRRPDSVEIGSLQEDLKRRDFTVNAIAQDVDTGEIIDPFHGIDYCKIKTLKCVGNAKDRFEEDHLRLLRAIRFSITKRLELDREIIRCLNNYDLVFKLKRISKERILDELMKCFKYDTIETIRIFNGFLLMRETIFNIDNFGIWLKPTLERK